MHQKVADLFPDVAHGKWRNAKIKDDALINMRVKLHRPESEIKKFGPKEVGPSPYVE